MYIKIFHKTLWLLPFICFFIGYQLLNQLYKVEKIANPNLVGQTISDAIKTCSNLNLNLRIISEQVEPNLPENTILSQKPNHAFIKQNQIVFVVASKKPEPQFAPNLYGLTASDIEAKLKKLAIKNKSYYLPSIAPKDTCFGQSVTPEEKLNDHKLIDYISTGHNQLVIMPSLVSCSMADIKILLDSYQIKLNIKPVVDDNLPLNSIIEQKPQAGTIIDLNKLTQIELCVASKKEN